MDISALSCPHCGGQIEPDTSPGFFTCRFCGTLLEKGGDNRPLTEHDLDRFIADTITKLKTGNNVVRFQACGDIRRVNSHRAVKPVAEAIQWFAKPESMESGDLKRSIKDSLEYVFMNTSDPAAVPLYIEFLNGSDPFLAQLACYAFDRNCAKEAYPHLLALLRSGDYFLRAGAAGAIGAMGKPEAGPFLIELLEDDSIYVRHSAVYSLGKLKLQDAVRPLWKILKNDDHDKPDRNGDQLNLRETVATTLGSIGGEDAAKYLVKALDDGNMRVRAAANKSLLYIESKTDDPGLKKMIAEHVTR